MVTSEVQTLLAEVRGRLWRDQLTAATRLSLWASAGLMLIAAAVHLGVHRVPVVALLVAIAGPWSTMLVRVGWRRPSDAACALWADRHLGGSSAFTTLLEVDERTPDAPDAQAVRWLAHWASTKVADSLRMLTAQTQPARLYRPLLSAVVCSALATFVVTLPDLSPGSQLQGAAAPQSGMVDRPTPDSEAAESAALASEVASALRSAASDKAPERRAAGRATAADVDNARNGREPLAAQSDIASPGERGAESAAPPGSSVDTAAMTGTAQGSGNGAGRDAGDSRDNLAKVGVSQVPHGTIAMQRSVPVAQPGSAGRRADLERLAIYDEEDSTAPTAAMRAGPAPPAATPPSATESTRLTPAETSYVQAWMRASGHQR